MKNYLLFKNQNFFSLIIVVFLAVGLSFTALAQTISYPDSWGKQGFTLKEQRTEGVQINYSVQEFTVSDIDIKGEAMKTISLPGHLLPNDAGAPDLPGTGKYIAIPQGAKVKMNITSSRVEKYENISIAPAFIIPKDTDKEPLKYEKNKKIYERNALYPSNPVILSEPMKMRGVDIVILGITPFQYNPVTGELLVYRDLEVELVYEGSTGQYGDNRLRSRFWDPIIKDAMINPQVLPEIDYTKKFINNGVRETGAEYVIVVPDDDDFKAWADTLRKFRIKQGITTMVVTTTEIGGNTTNAIEAWVDNAYATWDIPPAAILLMADYGSGGNSINSPIWDGYCISDHIYSDVDGDDMGDIIFARMTAQNADHCELMVNKVIDYETNPPTSADYYDHPITALGWQTERWFQICSESVGGYLKHVQGKDPVRINAIYSGNPNTDPWSTNQNTDMIMAVFGPDGLGYIPATPAELGGWTGGNATMVNNAINDGSFMLQHRDHGGVNGWGEPDYGNSDLAGLSNEDLTYVFSINCLTGKFNASGECFAEAFHRHQQGVYGILAATEVSYSFVNDTYVWGLYDHMWPDFLPGFETTPETRGLYPAFGNVAGKYFLLQSEWPYNTNNKEVTYYLFHHHGCAFSTMYSEVPQNLTVVHDDVLLSGLDYFTVTADEGSTIALTVGDEIIGLGTGTGAPVNITIAPQVPPAMVNITITKTNYYRYNATVQVIPPSGPYIVNDSYTFTDENGNEQMDNGETILVSLAMKNVGSENADNVVVSITTEDEYVSINDDSEDYGTIPSQDIVTMPDGFAFVAAYDIPDLHNVAFNISATDGNDNWTSNFVIQGHAPELDYADYSISDPLGNNNGKLDPGETVDIIVFVGNTGSAPAYEVSGLLECSDEYVTINQGQGAYGEISPDGTGQQSFSVSVSAMTPVGHEATFNFEIGSLSGHTGTGSFTAIIGQIPILVIDLDGNNTSGPWIRAKIVDLGITAQYATSFPATELSLYNTVFVCLGIYEWGNNHVLSNTEGTTLANFLDNGGKVYMEGGDTWYYDDATPVHSYFNISGAQDGSDDLGTIDGQSGTFTDGMSFEYTGDNNYIDRINPQGDAFVILKNASPAYNTGIAYDGGSYKTIGTSHEFGGLEDGDYTKEQLMEKYLEFFGFTGLPAAPTIPEGINDVCNTDQQVEYCTHAVENADYYIWMVDPPEAGLIFGTDTVAHVNWDSDFAGFAQVKVCGMNATGPGPFSEGIDIAVRPAPTAVLDGGEFNVCIGNSFEITAQLTGEGPWNITLSDGNVYTSNSTNWSQEITPSESTEYSITAVADSYCENEGEGLVTVTVFDLPVVSLGADTSICFYHTIELSVPAGFAAVEWSDGSTGNSILIEPEAVGQEDIWVAVTDNNGCQGTDEITITFTECAGIDENFANQFVQIYPNPTNGILYLKPVKKIDGITNIRILNAYGSLVYSQDNIDLNNAGNKGINLSDQKNGVYFLIFENENIKFNKKIVIQN